MGICIMNRKELEKYISETYSADPEYPWESTPASAVFRHAANRKWFALLMDIPRSKLGMQSDDMISVVNLKCDPLMTGSVCMEKGIYPAYHMNKNYWISVALDGTVPDETVKMLLDMSFDATMPKVKKKKG